MLPATSSAHFLNPRLLSQWQRHRMTWQTIYARPSEKECVVVFDEAHNIDNVCIEVGPGI